ncbi:permease [candidate division WOR-3 bacterium]|nr:permease [candidate division WOR-3 bacterium]
MTVEIIAEIWNLLLIVSPWLLVGLLIAGLIHSFIGEDFIRHHLGGSGFLPVLKSTLFGIPLPVCSCGVIPIAAGLRKDGASKASTMAFLVSTPTTGIDSIFVTYAFLGGIFTIARPLAALFAGLVIGVLVYIAEKEKMQELSEHGPHSQITPFDRIKQTFIYGFRILPQDLGRTLLFGIILGGMLSALIPQDIANVYLSNPFIAYPMMLFISVPLYVCAIGAVPIAAVLLLKGLVPGAALAFLIAGPATNTITLAFVGKKMGGRVLFLYLTTIIIIAIVFGVFLDLIIGRVGIKEMISSGSRLPYLLQLISSILILVIILLNTIKGRREDVKMDHSFYVPDMACKHCQMTIEQALKEVPGVKKIAILLDKKLVKIDGEINEEKVVKQIEDAGYTVEREEIK